MNFLTAMGYIDVSMNQIRSLDLSNLTGLMSVFCSENGMESLYLNENANLNSLQTDPDTEVFYVPGRGYDDVNTDDWGDTEINPWN